MSVGQKNVDARVRRIETKHSGVNDLTNVHAAIDLYDGGTAKRVCVNFEVKDGTAMAVDVENAYDHTDDPQLPTQLEAIIVAEEAIGGLPQIEHVTTVGTLYDDRLAEVAKWEVKE